MEKRQRQRIGLPLPFAFQEDEMYHFELGRSGQQAEILAFIERAFATAGATPGFERLLPKLYGSGRESESHHILLYADTTLEGVCAVQVQTFIVAGQPLQVGWVGSVAVAPEARGKGHLERLVTQANRMMEQTGCDLAVLGGQRQRYRRFGYEYGGSQLECTLTSRNLNGAKPGSVQLRPLESDERWRLQAYEVWQRGPVRAARTQQNFFEVLCSWGAQPCAVLYKDKFAGYCTLEILPDRAVLRELYLDEAVPWDAFGARVLEFAEREAFTAVLPPWAGRLQSQLAVEAEKAQLVENHSYRVLRWSQVLAAALALRAETSVTPNIPGSFCFTMDNGPPLRLWAEEGGPLRCSPALSGETPLSLSGEAAVRLLLGPLSALEPGAKSVPPGWLPLPLAFSWQDGI